MTILAPFPDVEALLLDMLGQFATAGTVVPADMQDRLPFLWIVCTGGNDDVFSDVSRIDVHAFAATRAAARALAEQVRTFLDRGTGIATASGVLDRVTTDRKPVEVPWATDSTVRRFVASYRVVTRR